MARKGLNRENVGKLSLDAIVDVVPGIYEDIDVHRSIWDTWLHATHHAAAIGEEVRKYKPGKKLLEEIADFSMWLFTFVGKIGGPFENPGNPTNRRIEENTIKIERLFSEIIWSKYPRICPVCFWRRVKNNSSELEGPCDCLIYEIEDRDKVKGKDAEEEKNKDKRDRVKALRQYAMEVIETKPPTIDEWQEMFRELYKSNLRHVSLIDIGFHLLEEVGEVSDAMVRMYTYTDSSYAPRLNQIWLEEEIADVYSWLVTLVNSLQIIPDIANEFLDYLELGKLALPQDGILLSQIIWYRYGSKERGAFYCPTCTNLKCTCDITLIGQNKDYGEFLEYAKQDPL